MSRRCEATGKGVMSGNNVSHAHNKSRRRFLPNIQQTSLYSEALDEMVRLRLAVAAIRTIEAQGGIDDFLVSAPDAQLSDDARKIKKRIKKVLSKVAA
ncbi:MAG: 50S ribosomal protein L28 [Rhodospirillaceae bacterium]|jgi:large subunit ribosomal protein L28|nr:50S ribosomal protein L28 [Rhodospirillaceae bacterium]MBT5374509.1 50S ribosomal protein L28 [Rhodospirillaceae bacterium]MBT5659925.1 50S ribosomal protein L28 [Rhodospirillaceae bacterium]MBT5751814.1 50S ribosomal protein L28 [Rhodospirillaceae bacterium]